MAALAQSSEIFGSAIFGSMIQMSYRKHNFYHLSMAIVHYRMVLTSAELTSVVCSLQNLLAYLFPILRVSSLVFWFDWHGSSSLFILLLAFEINDAVTKLATLVPFLYERK